MTKFFGKIDLAMVALDIELPKLTNSPVGADIPLDWIPNLLELALVKNKKMHAGNCMSLVFFFQNFTFSNRLILVIWSPNFRPIFHFVYLQTMLPSRVNELDGIFFRFRSKSQHSTDQTSYFRSTQTTTTITVEVGDAPGEDPTDPAVAENSMDVQAVNLISADVATAYQSGTLESVISQNMAEPIVLEEMTFTQALDEPNSASYNETVAVMDEQLEENGAVTVNTVSVTLADYLEVEWERSVFETGVMFGAQPRVKVIDEDGDHMMQLGLGTEASFPWQLTVSSPDSDLIGNTMVNFTDGYFTFDDLQINEDLWNGTQLVFQLGPYPSNSTMNVTSEIFVRPADCKKLDCEFEFATCTSTGCFCLPQPNMVNFTEFTTVNCAAENGVTVEVDHCALLAATFNPSDFYIGGLTEDPGFTPAMASAQAVSPNNTCLPVYDPLTLSQKWSIVDLQSDCGAEINVLSESDPGYSFEGGSSWFGNTNPLMAFYSNAVQGYTGNAAGLISRRRHLKIEYSCAFPLEATVSASALTANLETVRSTMVTGNEGTFNISMALYEDETFTTILPEDSTIFVPNYIHLAVSGDLLDGRYVIQVDSCWATPTADSSSDVYSFMNGGCPSTDLAAVQGVVVNGNGAGGSVTVKVESFTWDNAVSATGEGFLHCAVNVCDTLDGSCEPLCSGRRKRQVGAGTESLRF